MTLFAAAIGLAVLARFNPGNVVLFYPPYRVDLSLNFFIFLLTTGFALLFFLLNTVRSTLEMPERVSQYRLEKRQRESGRALIDALKAYLEGRYGQAEKSAARASQLPENEGLAALLAARSAHRLQQVARRDAWLLQSQKDPALRNARLMTTIELLAEESRDSDGALLALEELNASGIRHIQALRLSLRVNQHKRNWQEVLRLVRLLDKRQALHPTLSQRLRDLSYESLLPTTAHDSDTLKNFWAKVPSSDKTSTATAVVAASAFMSIGLRQDAANIIEKALAVNWDGRLLKTYRLCAAPEGSATLLSQIEYCENCLREHPNDAELSLTLGAFCLRQKLWGKAQRHLDHALSDANERNTIQECHLKLGQLNEALNQNEVAASHYRQCAIATMPRLNRS